MLINTFYQFAIIQAFAIPLVNFLILTLTLAIAQNAVNSFINNPNRIERELMNASIKEAEKKRKKDPKLPPVPVTPQKPQKDDVPVKKVNQDPIADKKNNSDPDPNNDDGPRKIPERKSPDPDKKNNQTITNTPLKGSIDIKKPPLYEHTGKLIYQPIENVDLTLYSMPVNNEGIPDYSGVMNNQVSMNKSSEYVSYLGDSLIDEPLGKYKISDLIPYFMSPSCNIDSSPTLFNGTESLNAVTHAFENYSDGFLSNPIYFIPTKINVEFIDGITRRKRRYGDDIDNKFKPNNPELTQSILDNIDFPIPKEVSPEQLLELAGHVATFEGGAEKWEEYKNDPTKIKDPEFFKVPTGEQILNEDVNGLPRFQPQKLKVNNAVEYITIIAGTLYTKLGLNEFPSNQLPSVKNLDPLAEDDTNQNNKSRTKVRVGNLASGLSYLGNWFNLKLGDFPVEVEVPDPENNDKNVKEKVNISSALTNLLTIGGVGLAMQQFGNNVNLKNAGEIEATKNVALKGAECACINTANSGMNTRPKENCNQGAFNFTTAKGFGDMLSNKKRCHQGTENQDTTTIKSMLENILFGVNIIKSSSFKGSKEITNQEKVLKDLLKGKLNDKELDDFIDTFNNRTNLINKDYPKKAKIKKGSIV